MATLEQIDDTVQRLAQKVAELHTTQSRHNDKLDDLTGLVIELNTVVFGNTSYGVPGIAEVNRLVNELQFARDMDKAKLDGIFVSLRWLGASSLATLLTVLASIVGVITWLVG